MPKTASGRVRQRTDKPDKGSYAVTKCCKRTAEKLEKTVVYRLKQLIGLNLEASDGKIGTISDVYFDDHSWAVRYLIVEAGAWLTDRKVLISPISVSRIDWEKNLVEVSLTCQQIRKSPPIDMDKPVLSH